MLIDWLTLSLSTNHIPISVIDHLVGLCPKNQRISADGEIEYWSTAWMSQRSDYNSIAWHISHNQLIICGSPASLSSSNNVFGTSNIHDAFNIMLTFFKDELNVDIDSRIINWSCSRIDITRNADLTNQTNVQTALECLKHSNTRGNNVERRNTTVYWNKSSSLRSAKAYNKYEHALQAIRKKQQTYTHGQLEKCKRLLRLELKLGRKWFYDKRQKDKNFHFSTLNDKVLLNLHQDFFDPLIGSTEINTMSQLYEKLVNICNTESQARICYTFYKAIQLDGIMEIKRTYPKSTYYRNIKILKSAGLSVGDIQSGKILEFRRKTIKINDFPISWKKIA